MRTVSEAPIASLSSLDTLSLIVLRGGMGTDYPSRRRIQEGIHSQSFWPPYQDEGHAVNLLPIYVRITVGRGIR